MAKGIYVGVSETEKLTTFSDCPFPNFTTNTATDKYGTWTVSCSSQRNSTTYAAYNAFDTDTGTLWGSGKLTTNFAYVQLDFPQGVSIKPTTVMMTYASCGTGSCVQGYNPDTGEWVTIGNTSQLSTSDKVESFAYSGTVYFTAIRAYVNAYSGSYAYVSNLKITAGTIKTVGQYTIAHKVTKAYVGVDDKARKIKKGYIGVGGVARPFFSAERKLEYYGTAESLTLSKIAFKGTSVGNYAIFAGGYDGNNVTATADAYGKNLAKSTPTSLSTARMSLASAKTNNYALFAGGQNNSSTYYKIVDAYDASLARSTPTALIIAVTLASGASAGNYAIFAGGYDGSERANVNAYDENLTRTNPTALSLAVRSLAGTNVGEYAIFAGGYTTVGKANAVAYNSSLVKTVLANLSVGRGYLAAASVGDYALFAGGNNTSGVYRNEVDSYNSSLVKTTPTELSVARQELSGASVDGYAIFAGGYDGSVKTTVDAYDVLLARSTPTALSVSRTGLAATSVGDYALFAGGQRTSTSKYKTVDVYQTV